MDDAGFWLAIYWVAKLNGLLVMFCFHYPTRDRPASKAKPYIAGSYNLHITIKWLKHRKNPSRVVTWSQAMCSLIKRSGIDIFFELYKLFLLKAVLHIQC